MWNGTPMPCRYSGRTCSGKPGCFWSRFTATSSKRTGTRAWSLRGIIHAMGALDQSPEALGGLIGAALVGTFCGIFLSYAIIAPMAQKIKAVRQKQLRLFTLVKQSLLAFMNGAMPQVAVEFGRKTIPSRERPTIDVVENETTSAPAGDVIKEAT